MPVFGRKKKQAEPEPEPEPEPEAAPLVQTSLPQTHTADAPAAQPGPSSPLEADEDLQDLVDAVTNCDLAKLNKCLDEASDLDVAVNEPFEDGTTLLWLACQLGHKDIVDRLIAAGADVDGVAFDESTRES